MLGLLAHTQHDVGCNLGADLPVMIAALFSEDEPSARSLCNYRSTRVDLEYKEDSQIKLLFNSTIFCLNPLLLIIDGHITSVFARTNLTIYGDDQSTKKTKRAK